MKNTLRIALALVAGGLLAGAGAQQYVYVRCAEARLEGIPGPKDTLPRTVPFGTQLRVLQETPNELDVVVPETGQRGWLPRLVVTANHREISYFETRALIPNTFWNVYLFRDEAALRRVYGREVPGSGEALEPFTGLVLLFPDDDRVTAGRVVVLGSVFENVNPKSFYIYNGTRFEELSSDSLTGFVRGRVFPLYRPPELDPNRAEIDGQVSLNRALARKLIGASFTGHGAYSGDVIRLAVWRRVPEKLLCYVIPGTVLKSTDPACGSMIIGRLRGILWTETSYQPRRLIELADDDTANYVIEGYDLDFAKLAPTGQTRLEFAGVDTTLQKIIYQGMVAGVDLETIQAALWIARHNVAPADMKQKLDITDLEIETGRELIRRAAAW